MEISFRINVDLYYSISALFKGTDELPHFKKSPPEKCLTYGISSREESAIIRNCRCAGPLCVEIPQSIEDVASIIAPVPKRLPFRQLNRIGLGKERGTLYRDGFKSRMGFLHLLSNSRLWKREDGIKWHCTKKFF